MRAQPIRARPIAPPALGGLSLAERTVGRRCLLGVGVLTVGNIVGATASLYLAVHHPLVLVAISPLGWHLLRTAPTVGPR